MAENSEKRRGGKREGAGRPRKDTRVYSFRLPAEIGKKIDRIENKSEFVRQSLQQSLSSFADALRSMGEVTEASNVKGMHLPFFDVSVVAGFPVPLDNDERSQDIEILSLLCPHPESSYLVRIQGNSMVDAGIFSGDIVIVDKSRRDPTPKEIAVCELNGEYTLKRFMQENGKGWLVPANPAYPRIPVEEGDDFRVWGTVTYIIHKARD